MVEEKKKIIIEAMFSIHPTRLYLNGDTDVKDIPDITEEELFTTGEFLWT